MPATPPPPAGVRTRGGCSYKATPEESWLIESDRGPWARRSQAACTPRAQRTRATPTRAGATPGRTSTSSSTPHSSANTHSSRITQALESPHLAPDSSPGSSHRHGLNTPVQPAIPLPHMVNGFAKVAKDRVTVRLLCFEHSTSQDLQRDVHHRQVNQISTEYPIISPSIRIGEYLAGRQILVCQGGYPADGIGCRRLFKLDATFQHNFT